MNNQIENEIKTAIKQGDRKFLEYVVESVLLRRELEKMRDATPSNIAQTSGDEGSVTIQ